MIYHTSMINQDKHYHTTINSPLGKLKLIASQKGLRAILWQDQIGSLKISNMIEDSSFNTLKSASQQLNQYFNKTRTIFNLPLDITGTSFQVTVWQALSKIPYGTTINYSQQARLIDNPKAIRAVGRANGQNPVPIILPCHRVIGTNKTLTGFRGGLNRKLKLLELEGVLTNNR